MEKALKKRTRVCLRLAELVIARKTTGYLQMLCKEQKSRSAPLMVSGAPDGLCGGYLQPSYRACVLPRPWRDDAPLNVNPNKWPRRAEADLIAFYGEHGTNQVTLELPYPHRIAWDLREAVNRFTATRRYLKVCGVY